jgi:hypothetical protein
MPRSSCIHRVLPLSGPLDGARWCSLEGSASRPPPPAVSPPESSRPSFSAQWCSQSCLFLAAVRGAQPHGGWRSSVITWLQEFSSCSLVATSRRWSFTRMTTSLVVERSEPGCSIPPALSFKDVHHPRWGGGRAKLGSCLSHGLAARFFLQHLGEKGVHEPCGGGELWVRGAGRLQVPSVAVCSVPRLGWLRCCLRRCLMPFGQEVAAYPPHGRRSRHAQVRHIHGFSRATARTGGSYKTPYVAGVVAAFLDGLVLTPAGGQE